MKGYDGRIYQVRAILISKPPVYPEVPEVLATTQSEHFVLNEETSKPVLTIKETDYRQKPLGTDGAIISFNVENFAPFAGKFQIAFQK